MDRKLCADCGNSSLASESICWACGGCHFSAPTDQPVGERTVALNPHFERTMSWPAASRQNRQIWWGLGSAFGLALFMCVLGYWLGRASAPAPPPPAATAANPIPLGTPPTALTFSPASGTAIPAAAPAVGVSGDSPAVTVRSRPSALTPHPVPAVVPYPGALATPVGPAAGYARRSAPPRASVSTSVARSSEMITAPVAPPLPANAAVAAPGEGGAVVMVRNDAASSVTLTLDGPSSRTVIVGAGCTVPVNLAPGSYRVGAGASGASSTRSSLSVSAGGSYSLVVNSRSDGGQNVLSLMEPAVGG